MGWSHGAEYVHYRAGRIKVVCLCGKQSPKMASLEAAREWYLGHTKTKEKPQGGVS